MLKQYTISSSDIQKTPSGFAHNKPFSLANWQPAMYSLLLLVLLLLAGTSYWSHSWHERLFQAYFPKQLLVNQEQYRVLASSKDPTLTSSLLYQQALQYHYQQAFPEALMAWRAYFKEESQPSSVLPYIYATHAAHSVGNVEAAAYFLQQLPEELADEQGEQLLWYRAITALRLKKTSQAHELLERISLRPLTLYGKELAPRLLEEIARKEQL